MIGTRRTTQSGFTLLEILVATLVFMLLSTAITNLYVAALNLQQRATATAHIEENFQYVVESMSRELRTGVVSSGNCVPPANCATITVVYPNPVTGNSVTATYAYTGTAITLNTGSGAQQITSTDVVFTNADFYVSGSTIDQKQTEVTIAVTGQVVTKIGTTPTLSLQTTIASRDMTVK